MKVIIHDVSKNGYYLASRLADCRDETDKQVYKLVNETFDVITMGCIIGEPLTIGSQDRIFNFGKSL